MTDLKEMRKGKIEAMIKELEAIKASAVGKDRELLIKHSNTCIEELSWLLIILGIY